MSRQQMYPDFIAQAEKDQNDAAIETFSYAEAAEAEHAKLYTKALNNLNEWKVADAGFSSVSYLRLYS